VKTIRDIAIALAAALVLGFNGWGCAGADGEDGREGPPGPRGEQGEPGPAGAANSDVIVQTILCTGEVDGTFLTAYIWLLSDGDAVGICDLDEFEGSDTEPLIGNTCSLVSRRLIIEGFESGLITITFSDQGALLSGAFTGGLECQ
jgi:hypothetical protein